MLFTGLAEFEAMGLASLMVVAVAMVGSVTVLPALLSLLGERVEKGRLPFLHPDKRRARGKRVRSAEEGSRFWSAVLRVVLAKPAVSLVVAAGALLAIAAPALGMKTQQLTLDKEFGNSLAIVGTYNRVNDAFPGGSEPPRWSSRRTTSTPPT